MSSRRSLSAGTCISTVFRRNNKSSRNCPAVHAARRSVLVAEITRTSIRRGWGGTSPPPSPPPGPPNHLTPSCIGSLPHTPPKKVSPPAPPQQPPPPEPPSLNTPLI